MVIGKEPLDQGADQHIPTQFGGGRLVFATSSEHKLIEARRILAKVDLGENSDNSADGHSLLYTMMHNIEGIENYIAPAETADSLMGNALLKLRHALEEYIGPDAIIFAEDTGLCVAALGGSPGVLTARYAGVGASDEANMERVLEALGDNPNRAASFHTEIALWDGQQVHQLSGVCCGHIAQQQTGSAGFGYDPIFIPEGETQCFAELGADRKDQLSHRQKALEQIPLVLRGVYGILSTND